MPADARPSAAVTTPEPDTIAVTSVPIAGKSVPRIAVAALAMPATMDIAKPPTSAVSRVTTCETMTMTAAASTQRRIMLC